MLDYLRNMKFYDADDGAGEGAGAEGNGDNGNGEPNEPPVEPTEPKPTPTKNEILRELSKEYGVNLFEAEGLQKYKEYVDSQKTEQDKMQEQLQEYEQEKSKWESERLNYESKLKATQLGINEDNLADVLKLADNDPNKIEEIVKKYPNFRSKDGIKIGVQDPANNKQPTDKSDVEAYMASNPRIYKK